MQLLSGKVLARLKSLQDQTNNTAGIIILPAGSAAANMTLLAIAAYIMHQQDTDTKKKSRQEPSESESKPHRNSGAPAGPGTHEEDNSREREACEWEQA